MGVSLGTTIDPVVEAHKQEESAGLAKIKGMKRRCSPSLGRIGYPPSSTKANSNFNFSKSSRFSSDMACSFLTVKATWHGDALNSRSAPMR